MKKITLICTVGTSFFQGNLSKLANEPENYSTNLPLDKLVRAYTLKDWSALALSMLEIPPNERVLGAEINTIEFINARLHKEHSYLGRIVFLVSDTEDGTNTGKVLKEYYERRALQDERFSDLVPDYRIVKDLQDADPHRFRKSGLLNLVREISSVIKETGDPSNVIIDATGGYKAQIAIAVMFGQALGIDVIYKHERFSTIIDFPPMPVSLDFSYFDQFNDLFLLYFYEPLQTLNFRQFSSYFDTAKPINSYSELVNHEEFQKIKLFFDIEEVSGEHLFSMNYAGFIYAEAALKLQWQLKDRKTELKPLSDSERKPPQLRDDHYPIGFREYVERIWRQELWIATIVSIPYDKQRGIKQRGFYIKRIQGEKQLIGYYQDKNGFGARFRILMSSDMEPLIIRSAVTHLNSKIDVFG